MFRNFKCNIHCKSCLNFQAKSRVIAAVRIAQKCKCQFKYLEAYTVALSLCEAGTLRFTPTTIQDGAALLCRANVLPGAVVGDHTVVLENSLIPPGAHVEAKSIVGGSPYEFLATRLMTLPSLLASKVTRFSFSNGHVAALESTASRVLE